MSRYSGLLLRGLSHGSPRVQSLAVAQLARSAHDEDLAAQLVSLLMVLIFLLMMLMFFSAHGEDLAAQLVSLSMVLLRSS